MEETQTVAKKENIFRPKHIYLVSKENDIKFRGKLSYRHLRIAGWFFLFVTALGTILSMANKGGLITMDTAFLEVLTSAKSLMTPLFLIAAFSQVLMVKNGYRRLILTYCLAALGIYLGFLLAYFHFGVGLLAAIGGDYGSAFLMAETFVAMLTESGSVAFNVFMDLLLCSLVAFFINYTPTKYFQGKKIYIFRALVVLPLLYECGSIAIKILTSVGVMSLSAFVLPLLTTKPPVAFFIFVALALFMKIRQKYFIKKGKTNAEYKAFIDTNVNRLHFSLFLVISIIVAAIVDLLLFVLVYSVRVAFLPAGLEQEELEVALAATFLSTYNLGFGGCLTMILIIPFIIFFDYTKTYKDKKFDLIIPAVGVGILIIVFIEGMFEILKGYLSSMGSKEEDSFLDIEDLKFFITQIKNYFIK